MAATITTFGEWHDSEGDSWDAAKDAAEVEPEAPMTVVVIGPLRHNCGCGRDVQSAAQQAALSLGSLC